MLSVVTCPTSPFLININIKYALSRTQNVVTIVSVKSVTLYHPTTIDNNESTIMNRCGHISVRITLNCFFLDSVAIHVYLFFNATEKNALIYGAKLAIDVQIVESRKLPRRKSGKK